MALSIMNLFRKGNSNESIDLVGGLFTRFAAVVRRIRALLNVMEGEVHSSRFKQLGLHMLQLFRYIGIKNKYETITGDNNLIIMVRKEMAVTRMLPSCTERSKLMLFEQTLKGELEQLVPILEDIAHSCNKWRHSGLSASERLYLERKIKMLEAFVARMEDQEESMRNVVSALRTKILQRQAIQGAAAK